MGRTLRLGCVWVPASICGIVGREKRQVSHEAGLKAGLGSCEAGLPGWPMLPRGDQIREFRCPIQESRAGTVKGRDNYGQGQLWAGTVIGRDSYGQGQL